MRFMASVLLCPWMGPLWGNRAGPAIENAYVIERCGFRTLWPEEPSAARPLCRSLRGVGDGSAASAKGLLGGLEN